MQHNKRILLLGNGPAVEATKAYLTQHYPDYAWMQVVYGHRNARANSTQIIRVTPGQETEQIAQAVGANGVGGIVNRMESYVPLCGKLVDHFGVPGSSYQAVMRCKDKARLDQLMRENGLVDHRPETQLLAFDGVAQVLGALELPIVIKPYSGAKSRGVFILRRREMIEPALSYLRGYFEAPVQQMTGVEPKVLLEEFVDGVQLTATCFVNDQGKVVMISFVDVLTGKDLGEAHSQLVYRTVPSLQPTSLLQRVENLLQRVIDLTGLRSVFLHPEFMIVGGKIYLIELNVRIGGFRNEMMALSQGIDLGSMAIELALGQRLPEHFTEGLSCTAVEVWDSRAGQLRRLRIPKDERMKQLKLFFKEGDFYVGPPVANKPLAHYYVVDEEDSLTVAKEIRAHWEVEVG